MGKNRKKSQALSAAKHLQYLFENEQMQILRAVYPERSERAQDDNRRDHFPQPPSL
jgi:hypothetical protein